MFYLVTSSEAYYPQAGTDDWISVHTDEVSAREAFDAVEISDFSDATLVAVDPPNWRVLAQKP